MKRRKVLTAVLIVVAVAAVTAWAATPKPFVWVLSPTGGWSTGSRAARVDTACDGPRRVYVARSDGGDSGSVGVFVLKNGCLSLPAEAEKR